MKIKYNIYYILEKYLVMPEKSNIKKNISKQVKKAKQQRGGNHI
jgi:hypothetical protein